MFDFPSTVEELEARREQARRLQEKCAATLKTDISYLITRMQTISLVAIYCHPSLDHLRQDDGSHRHPSVGPLNAVIWARMALPKTDSSSIMLPESDQRVQQVLSAAARRTHTAKD